MHWRASVEPRRGRAGRRCYVSRHPGAGRDHIPAVIPAHGGIQLLSSLFHAEYAGIVQSAQRSGGLFSQVARKFYALRLRGRQERHSPLPSGLLDRLQQGALGRGAILAGIAGQFRQAKLHLAASDARAKFGHVDDRRLIDPVPRGA